MFKRILIVGCGNMGGAMLEGWLAGGAKPSRFAVLDPRIASAPGGVGVVREVEESPDGIDTVMLGFKPQQLASLSAKLSPVVDGRTVLSILAGVDLAALRRAFPRSSARVRIMPNLAAALGKSPIAVAAEGLDERGEAALFQLLGPLGAPERVDEAQFDLVTALAGSGPGFLYRFVEALAEAAARLGLPPIQAERLAIAMTEGAATLAARSNDGPGALADKVASPGGVTRAGLNVLDKDRALFRLMRETLAAAERRSAEMTEQRRTDKGQ